MSSSQNKEHAEEKGEQKQFRFNQTYREIAPYFGLGLQLAFAVVVFYLIGHWLDEKYGTTPWLGLLGLFVGSAGGFIKFFKTVADLSKDKDVKKKEPV